MSDKKTCPKCGEELKAGLLFCPKCGSDGDGVDNAGGVESEKEKDFSTVKEEDASPKLGGKNVKIIAGVGVAVVAVVLAILFATHVICFHDYAPATCEKPMTCKICGRAGGTSLAYHDFSIPTCTQPATCSICGEQRGTAPGHDVANWEVTLEATCTTDGSRHGLCSKCGEDAIETIPAFTDHLVENWNIIEEATCTSDGFKEGTCSLCGEEVKSYITSSGHVKGSPVTKDEVTSSGILVWEYVYCSNCGKELSKEVAGVKESGHSYDVGEYVDVTGKVVKVSGNSFWLENANGIQFKCTPPNSGVIEYIQVGKTMDVTGKVLSTSAMSVNLENVTFSDYGR